MLGLWAGDGGEGAKTWTAVCTELKNRGVKDICILICDGLNGLPEAVNTVWPKTVVQTCVIHLIRNSYRYASRADYAAIAKDLRPIYTAPTEAAALERLADFAERWRAGTRRSFACGSVRGRSSPRSWPSTGRSGA